MFTSLTRCLTNSLNGFKCTEGCRLVPILGPSCFVGVSGTSMDPQGNGENDDKTLETTYPSSRTETA